MPCPHNQISIVQRSNRQSAVAAAAYQSGEKLFCEYDQEIKHYPEKRGIVHNEIMLPANAPQEYADRNTLWNAAEAVEKQWNSQLARRWVLTIPREIPPDQYAVLVREFCQQQFVSKGMIADFAIHDPHPPGHNPHAHVLLTMRAMDEHGKWLPKSRKVYDLDESGERIKLPSGRWKSHKEDTGTLLKEYRRPAGRVLIDEGINISTTYTADAGISAEFLEASLGFEVEGTSTFRIEWEATYSYAVKIRVYPVYEKTTGEVWDDDVWYDDYIGNFTVYRAVGDDVRVYRA